MLHLTVSQSAQILECSETKVRRMITDGTLTPINKDGHTKFDFFQVNSLRPKGKSMPVRTKMSIDKIDIKTLKEAVNSFKDDDVVNLVIEEHPHPALRAITLISENHYHSTVV